MLDVEVGGVVKDCDNFVASGGVTSFLTGHAAVGGDGDGVEGDLLGGRGRGPIGGDFGHGYGVVAVVSEGRDWWNMFVRGKGGCG